MNNITNFSKAYEKEYELARLEYKKYFIDKIEETSKYFRYTDFVLKYLHKPFLENDVKELADQSFHMFRMISDSELNLEEEPQASVFRLTHTARELIEYKSRKSKE